MMLIVSSMEMGLSTLPVSFHWLKVHADLRPALIVAV